VSPFRRKSKDESAAKEGIAGQRPASMYVRFMPFAGLVDVNTVSEEIRKGNIVIMDVSPLVERGSDLKLQLKRAVDQLRAVCVGLDGDIGQLGNRYVILTPQSVKIFREQPKEGEPAQPVAEKT
jgi:SepF-like predicted cell division protein (DUF552 family)